MKLMIMDNEPRIRKGFLELLRAREGWQVSGIFEDAHSALTALYDQEADMIVTDARMLEVSGLELIRQIRERNQGARIVILGDHDSFAYTQKAIELGVTRYLLKPTNPRELIAVLEGIEKGLEPTREEGEQEGQIQGDTAADNLADGDNVGNLLVQKAIRYVEVHYGGGITLKDASKELHLSPNYLCELFKRHTGENLMEYMTEYRMIKARTYLNHVEYKVSDVAETMGYKGAKYFNSAFRKTYGITPLEYRNKKQNIGK